MRRAGLILAAGWLAMLCAAGAAQAAEAGDGAPARTAYLAERLREGPAPVTDEPPRAAPRPDGPATPAAGPGPSGSPLPRFLAFALGPVLLLAAAGLLLRRRSRLRGELATPFALPRSVFADALRADEPGLRELATEEVVRLGEEARAARGGGPAAAAGALDAYAAARTVLDGARGVPDLAGVFALIAEGRAALSGSAPAAALPLCFFHPLHGPAARRIPWRPLGHREPLRVAACETCIRALRARRTPEVLTDRQDGRPVPYFEVPTADSLWAATGYGSLLGGDPLAGRVQRGDFTRTLT